jgi:uncharacterized repeat protein (TIGR01451 family)
LTYTLTITNNGPLTATGVTVTDDLPTGVTFGSASPACSEMDRVVTCTLDDMLVSDTAALTIAVIIDPSTTGALYNSAAVTATTPDTDTLDNTGTETTTVTTQADLAIIKTGDPPAVTAGASGITYTLRYTNSGPSDAQGVVITDTLPEGVTFAGVVSSPLPDPAQAGQKLTWSAPALAAEGFGSIVFTATVDPDATSPLVNHVVIAGTTTDPDTLNNADDETTTVTTQADLVITKTDDPATVIAGNPLTYTIHVANDGPSDADDVTVTDTLSSHVVLGSAVPSQGNCVGTTCDLGTVAAGDVATVTISVTVKPSTGVGTLSNSAGVESTTSDPNTSNNAVTELTTVATQADLAIAKADDPAPVDAGGLLTYTLTVTNNGPSDASGVVVSDDLRQEASFVSASAGCAYDSIEHSVDCSVGPLIADAGAEVTATVSVTTPLPNGTILTNTATVSGDQTDPNETNDSAQVQTTVRSAPILSLTKGDGSDPVEAGAQLTYTLAYTNTGNEIATGVIITELLDAQVFDFVADPPAQGSGSTRYWTFSQLPPGDPGRIDITVTVQRPLPDKTVLTNTAWLDTDQTEPLPAVQGTLVRSRPVLTVTKVGEPDPVRAGQDLIYTVIITNSGNENATSVTMVDDYDPNVSFVVAFPAPDGGSGNRQWTFSSLSVDTSEIITIVTEVTSPLPVGTVLTNEVTLDSAQTTPVSTTDTTQVLSQSELDVTQTDAPDPVDAGGELTYAILCKNTGTAPATGVVVTSTYDGRVTFKTAIPAPDVGDNVWNVGTLGASGGSKLIVVSVDVDSPLPDGSLLFNMVTIDSNETSPEQFVEDTSISSATDLSFSAAAQPDPVEAGDPLAYTLRYTNTGNADATQVIVTATLDANTSYANAIPAPTGGAGTEWYWELEKISGEGGVGEIVINTSVTLPLTDGTRLDFTAQLGDAEGDLLTDTVQTTVNSAPVLSLDKGNGVSTVYAGDRLTYTLTYANSGNENAYEVTITDTLPAGYVQGYIQYLGCQVPGDDCQFVSPDRVVFHLPVIVAQTDGQARIVLQLDDPLPAGVRSLTNQARMTSPSVLAPVDALPDVDAVGTRPDLTVAASHAPLLFSPGKLMTYTVTYGNAGQHMAAEDVVITTILPTGTTYVGDGWHSSDGQAYTYDAGDLSADDTGHTVEFVVRHVDQPEVAATEFDTPFTIAEGSSGGDANPGDNTTSVYIGVPDLVVLDFTVTPHAVKADKPVTFTVVLKNQGTGEARNPSPSGGPFWLDVFTSTVPSYPWVRFGELWISVLPIAPGGQRTVTLVHEAGFSEEEIRTIDDFYVKVDNYAEAVLDDGGRVIGWTDLYGLVPEYNEMNNVSAPSNSPDSYDIHLPVVLCR